MSSIDFIDRLKNQETKEEDNTSDSENSGTGSQFGFIYQEPEEKKSFLWEPLKKTPIEEIKVPERKLEYDSYYMDDSIGIFYFICHLDDRSFIIFNIPKRIRSASKEKI